MDDLRRDERRVPVQWAVDVRSDGWGEILSLTAGNVARGGLFVRADKPPGVGERVMVSITLPDQNRVELAGLVVHAEVSPGGFGIQFDSQHQLELELLYAAAAAQSSAGEAAALQDHPLWPDAHLLGASGQIPTIVKPLLTHLRAGNRARCIGLVARTTGVRPNEDDPSEVDASIRTLPIFGIDLGSATSSIAWVTKEGVQVLPTKDGQTFIPSVVCYADAGRPAVGWDAVELAASFPEHTVFGPKRLLGRKAGDERTQKLLKTMLVPHEAASNGELILVPGGARLTALQVCAEIFRELAAIGQHATGVAVARAVISAPASFDEQQRAHLECAARLAGIDVVALIEEPVSA
ncbi:MAG: Hsp70 family protein, partial [Deltaproteobacteria bacterium]|nr:Hsp70 family protein [Deltaproteobacteria bacterium]